MRFCNLAAQGQTESGPAMFSGSRMIHPVERLKYPLQMCGAHASAGVCHLQNRRSILFIRRQLDLQTRG
ncbi:hypothetical protein D3C87_2031300 [compost metagenome]